MMLLPPTVSCFLTGRNNVPSQLPFPLDISRFILTLVPHFTASKNSRYLAISKAQARTQALGSSPLLLEITTCYIFIARTSAQRSQINQKEKEAASQYDGCFLGKYGGDERCDPSRLLRGGQRGLAVVS